MKDLKPILRNELKEAKVSLILPYRIICALFACIQAKKGWGQYKQENRRCYGR